LTIIQSRSQFTIIEQVPVNNHPEQEPEYNHLPSAGPISAMPVMKTMTAMKAMKAMQATAKPKAKKAMKAMKESHESDEGNTMEVEVVMKVKIRVGPDTPMYDIVDQALDAAALNFASPVAAKFERDGPAHPVAWHTSINDCAPQRIVVDWTKDVCADMRH